MVQICDIVGVEVNFNKPYNHYFSIKVGSGDIYVYTMDKENFVAFCFFKERTDQMDVISFGLSCSSEKYELLYDLFVQLRDRSELKFGVNQPCNFTKLNMMKYLL